MNVSLETFLDWLQVNNTNAPSSSRHAERQVLHVCNRRVEHLSLGDNAHPHVVVPLRVPLQCRRAVTVPEPIIVWVPAELQQHQRVRRVHAHAKLVEESREVRLRRREALRGPRVHFCA